MYKFLSFCVVIALSGICLAQSESATLSGRVTDPGGSAVVGAQVVLTNVETNVESRTRTNSAGLYVFTGVHPGKYRVAAGAAGFRVLIKEGLVLHVQDELAENFALTLGTVSETVTVTADAASVNTTDATVSTVIDRNFAENLPMNGRSFQSLIQLTPGVVVTPSSGSDPGQFSINGQRTDANYWMVDGVSANIGVGVSPTGISGSLGGFSAQGGTNSLVSIDAMQEFRLQTSTYAPEFGRQPGGQISILTRSGTNQFHGTLFEYLRNDALDANNWFNGFCSPGPSCPIPKAEERQNNFGGTFGGPLVKDRTFFFFSYEGNRLRLPRTLLTTVPCDSSCAISGNVRGAASPSMQPFLNAFPLPNGADRGDGSAELNTTFSDASSLNAASLRIDHKLSEHFTFFGRYNYSPSDISQRAASLNSPNVISKSNFTTQTATLGATWSISSQLGNDFRFNYSRNHTSGSASMDSFGGAVPLASLPLPSGFSPQNADFGLNIFSLGNVGLGLETGKGAELFQRQYNVVDSLYLQRGSHSLKFGVDYRRLAPIYSPALYVQSANFFDVASAEAGTVGFAVIDAQHGATLLFNNIGLYSQDTWRVLPRLTLTYGLRWDIDFAPSSLTGPSLLAFTGYDLQNLATLALAPQGTAPYRTTYGNVAPRIGMAYQLRQNNNWGTVVRGGLGLFYDMASSQVGNTLARSTYPFLATNFSFGVPFPLSSTDAAPPAFTPAGAVASGANPHLELPYTLEWNFSLEQALGKQQSISATYTGAAGRRLLQTTDTIPPSGNFVTLNLIDNTATSDYDAMQLQFKRQLSGGLQAIASYTWAHSIDVASAGSFGNAANGRVITGADRASSDFDIRHAFSAALTYAIPTPHVNKLATSILKGWSLENIFQARSAPPVNIFDNEFFFLASHAAALIRPDVVPGQPVYLFGPQYPGGKGFNPAAFVPPPTIIDPIFGPLPTRQGNLPRNALRGFGAYQWDFAVHREFPVHESVVLQFRAEMFNVLNHPNFGPPIPNISPFITGFGKANEMLADSLNGGYLNFGSNQGNGSFSPIYQFGGPRTIQFALKLKF